jgi:MFS family permease
LWCIQIFNFLTKDSKISKRELLTNTFLVSGTLAWFFIINFYLNTSFEDIFGNIFGIWFYGSASLFAVVGVIIEKKLNRRLFLILWVTLGTISTLSLLFFSGYVFSVIISVFFGISLGLGLPTSLACMADSTDVGERGRVSGTIVLVSFLMAFITPIIIRLLSLGIMAAVLLTAFVRSTSIISLIFDSFDRTKNELRTYSTAARDPQGVRDFFYYLFPWVIFVFTSGAGFYMIPSNSENQLLQIGSILRLVCIAVFGFITGIVADRVGRKRPLIIGLAMFYTGFALVGFEINTITGIIYYLATGVAWGSLLVVYLSVPGDLSTSNSRAKYYTAGTMIPIIILLGVTSGSVPNFFTDLAKSPAFFVINFALFLTILPIIRAKETLTQDRIKERKLKEHLERVRKIVKEEEGPHD